MHGRMVQPVRISVIRWCSQQFELIKPCYNLQFPFRFCIFILLQIELNRWMQMRSWQSINQNQDGYLPWHYLEFDGRELPAARMETQKHFIKLVSRKAGEKNRGRSKRSSGWAPCRCALRRPSLTSPPSQWCHWQRRCQAFHRHRHAVPQDTPGYDGTICSRGGSPAGSNHQFHQTRRQFSLCVVVDQRARGWTRRRCGAWPAVRGVWRRWVGMVEAKKIDGTFLCDQW
jgi:hypothetical protein